MHEFHVYIEIMCSNMKETYYLYKIKITMLLKSGNFNSRITGSVIFSNSNKIIVYN